LALADPLPLECGFSVSNIYSNQDWITKWFALKYRNDPKYDVQFVPCCSSWSERTGYIADHAYLGGTYQNAQLEHIGELRKKIGFYNGKMR
jgi:hypothetical protein